MRLRDRVNELEEGFRRSLYSNLKCKSDLGHSHPHPLDNLVECEVCGCLLKKESAVKGKGAVRIIPEAYHIATFPGNFTFIEPEKEYIHHTYYCKVHAPKVKK